MILPPLITARVIIKYAYGYYACIRISDVLCSLWDRVKTVKTCSAWGGVLTRRKSFLVAVVDLVCCLTSGANRSFHAPGCACDRSAGFCWPFLMYIHIWRPLVWLIAVSTRSSSSFRAVQGDEFLYLLRFYRLRYVSREDKAIGNVRSSVCLFPRYLLRWLAFKLEFLYEYEPWL